MTALDIIDRVATARGIKVRDLRGPSRFRIFVIARHEAMFLLRVLTPMSYPDIGRAMGNRNHSTVMSACAKVSEACEVSPEYHAGLLAMVAT